MRPIKIVFLGILFLNAIVSSIQAQSKLAGIQILPLNEGTPTSIRGMSVVNDSVLWVSGSNNHVGRSEDGGLTWNWFPVNGMDSLDYRGITAFDSQKAIIASAGSPAYIFLTEDGGEHWEKVYKNDHKAIFLDGITFWNKKRGVVYGDPMDGRFVILRTKDGGRHWKMLPFKDRPEAVKGEASFAASGTTIVSVSPKYAWIGTGGMVSRILFSRNYGQTWQVRNTPMLQGKNTSGIFSLAFLTKEQGICVGGDYQDDQLRLNNTFLTVDGGKTWHKPIVNPFGYRSCVIYLNTKVLISTGTSGTDISFNGGMTWQRLSKTGYHVVQKAHNGREVYLAGSSGRIARLSFPQDIQEIR